MNYTLDARRVWSRGDRPLIPLGDLSRGYDVGTIDSVRGLGAGSFVQVYGTLSYTLRPGQIGVTGFYRDDARASRSYGIGPTLYMPLLERGGLQVSLRGDMTLSNRGRSAFFGLSLQRLRGASSTYANAGIRTISGAGAARAMAAVRVSVAGPRWSAESAVHGSGMAYSAVTSRCRVGSSARSMVRWRGGMRIFERAQRRCPPISRSRSAGATAPRNMRSASRRRRPSAGRVSHSKGASGATA
ncbi:hypothetical protein [Sphingomonas sp. 22R3R2A-7]|uniref:hypothetical protein n=1 Tax=Sphingomonas sp. 22R3R2A-7 TaxID=3050230 RepID=UPI002FDF9ED7